MNKNYSKVIKSYPCSNPPVTCDQCKAVYWSYNLECHYLTAHKSIEFESLISKEERIQMSRQ